MRIGRLTLDMFCLFGSMPSAVADRGEQIGHGDRPLFHRHAVLAGLADDLPALDAAAAQDDAPGVGEMVAALARVDDRRAAELAHPHHQRGFEQAALFRSAIRVAQAGIERLAELLHLLEVVVVRVPTAEDDLDERHAALHQAPGQQTALAEEIAAVAVAQLRLSPDPDRTLWPPIRASDAPPDRRRSDGCR